MSEFLTVVAAVDDSPSAAHAVRLAHAFADTGKGDRLFAAHAVPALGPAIEEVLFPFACFGDDYDALRLELIRGGAKRVTRALGKVLPGPADQMLKLTQGDPAAALPELLGELGPDIVVVGPGTHAGRGAHAIGSVPALLTRCSPAALAFARPSDGPVEIRRIVAGVDLSDDSSQVLGLALQLAHKLDATVQPVHVLPTSDAADHAGILTPDPALGGKARKAVTGRWGQIEARLDLPFPIAARASELLRKQVVTAGDPGPKLVELAQEAGADLIVLGRSRSGASSLRMGRVAEYVARHASCHVLLTTLESAEPHTTP